MRKNLVAILALGIILSLGATGNVQAQVLKQGMRGDEIKAIQEILKEDPTVYPEGYTTGYFGQLTKRALRRLQKKFGLPETGELDEKTEKVIFPVLSVKVISPNGGEKWDRSQLQTIKWETLAQEGESQGMKNLKRFFQPKVSIDLFKKTGESSIFVKHLGIYPASKSSRVWKISSDIPNGSDYVIRVTSGGRRFIRCVFLPEQARKNCLEKIFTQESASSLVKWDESDAPFTITGEVSPSSSPDLSKIIEALEKISSEINRLIEILKGMSVSQ